MRIAALNLVLLLFHLGFAAAAGGDGCRFPETEKQAFYFDVASDASAGQVILQSVVEPPDARLFIANVRSDALPTVNFTDRLAIEKDDTTGNFVVRVVSTLSLPFYPSTTRETMLFATVVCNEYAYPLVTVHLKAANLMPPQFYHEPYVVAVSRKTPVGSVIETPVAAIDWDPADSYRITFELEDVTSTFELVEPVKQSRGLIDGSDVWPPAQLPTVVRLRVAKPLTALPVSVRIIALDNDDPPKKSSTIVNVVEKVDGPPSKSPPALSTSTTPTTTATSKVAAKMRTTTTTTTTTTTRLAPTKRPVPLKTTPTPKALAPKKEGRAFGAKTRTGSAIDLNELQANLGSSEDEQQPEEKRPAKIQKADYDFSTYEGPPRFEYCTLRAPLVENCAPGTIVARLNVLNRTNTTRILLEDPDGTFRIDSRTGDVVVADARLIDRELFSTLEVVAQIEGASQNTQCVRTRLHVDIEDLNDNRPIFEKEKYWFHVLDEFPVGKEVGRLMAQDIDQGANGQVSYHLVSTETPFQVGTQGRFAVLLTTGTLAGDVYNLTVEARDHGEPMKSSRIPVDVFVLSSGKKAKNRLAAPSPPARRVDQKRPTAAAVAHGVPLQTAVQQPVEFDVDGSTTTTTSSTTTTTETTTTSTQERRPSGAGKRRPLSVGVVHPTLASGHGDVVEKNEVDFELATTRRTLQKQLNEQAAHEEHVRFEVAADLDEPLTFDFAERRYFYEVLGDDEDLVEDDVIGRVVARPDAQFYALDREVMGLVKINDGGELLVGKKLIAVAVPQNITFEASATNGERTARTVVTIWRDASSSPSTAAPRFDQATYKLRVLENRRPQVVGLVKAFHSSVGATKPTRIRYRLTTDDDGDGGRLPFEVRDSGEIATTSALDAERRRSYRFTVLGCISEEVCGAAAVVVLVDDANDNSPSFGQRSYTATVSSDLPVGGVVANVHADDADVGVNANVSYVISPPSAFFVVDHVTGDVRTTDVLTQPFYSILIEAFDHGLPRRNDMAELKINVRGTNPSAPVFDTNMYNVTLLASIRAGQVVAKLHASDPDPGVEGQISYRFAPTDDKYTRDDQAKFQINEKTGVVSAIQTLVAGDGPFSLWVEASDNGKSLRRKAKALLNIELVESRPVRFLPLPTTVYISTEKAVGSVVLRASASTTDESDIRFRVLQDHSQFIMDGDLLRVSNHLVEGETTLTIRAETDDSFVDHQLRVIVMADRDKYPVFPQLTYDIDVPSGGKFPRRIHQFDAKLANGTFRYNFFPPSSNPPGLFLDENTGELIEASNYATSPENRGTAFVVVRATNNEHPKFYSDVGVALTLKSSTPSLRFLHSIYRQEVYENTPVGAVVGTPMAVLPTNAPVQYSISPDTLFGIHDNGSLFVRRPIDVEQLDDAGQTLNFAVSASTGAETAKTRLQVTLRDVNEFRPEFPSHEVHLSVAENSQPGAFIGRVVADDADFSDRNHLEYKIVGGTGQKLVYIQGDGTIIAGDVQIDAERLEQFDLIVEASDRNGNHDQAHVVVRVSDENDNAPKFVDEPLVWNVTEGTTEAFRISATDEDRGANGDVRFAIVGGDVDGLFELDQAENNTARLRIASELDADKQNVYVLSIETRDEGDPQLKATTKLVVNVGGQAQHQVDQPSQVENKPQHPPAFPQAVYKQTVSMDAPIGFAVVNVAASDADGDRLMYRLSGDVTCVSQFAIDPMGFVSYKVPMNRRREGSIVCTVTASDGVGEATAQLQLHVFQPRPTAIPEVNRAPVFTQPSYSIAIRTDKDDLFLAETRAEDPENGQVVYSVEPAQFRRLVVVDSEGQLSLIRPASELTQSSYSFLVVAEDRGTPVMTTFANVRLTVIAMGTPASTTRRTSPSMPPVTLVEGPTTVTTEPTTTSTKPEAVGRFSQQSYNWTIPEEMSVGTVVGNVETDFDGPVDYSFVSTAVLDVDAAGTVTIVRPITSSVDDIIVATQNGKIVAEARVRVFVVITSKPTTTPSTTSTSMTTPSTSMTTPSTTTPSTTTTTTIRQTPAQRTSEATSSARIVQVPFEVTAATEPSTSTTLRVVPGGFAFSQPIYFAFAMEGNHTTGLEVELQPEPLATNFHGRVVFSIEDTALRMPFFLRDDGKLFVFDVDREQHSSFLFTIVARTVGKVPEEVAKARLNVTILDVNDNPPRFDEHPPMLGVSRSMHVGTPVYHLRARDADATPIAYEIVPAHFFSVDQREGMLRVASSLENAPDSLDVVVVAKDSGRPSLRAETKLTIEIFDDVVGAPRLPKDLAEVVVPNTAQSGTRVTQLLAGPSVAEHDKIIYTVAGDPSGLFAVEDNGILVLTRRPTDADVNKFHRLNVTAENSKGTDWTVVTVYVEGRVPATTPPASALRTCHFEQKIYKAQVNENAPARTAVTKVLSNCEREGRRFRYAFHQATDDFDIDAQSGEIVTKRPLDRETKAFHLLYINAVEQDTPRRVRRQSEVAVQQAASRLAAWQTLVVVTVRDENDNVPHFLHQLDDATLAATVDANAAPLTPVFRVQARDLDASPELRFELRDGAVGGTQNFVINPSTGLVSLVRSIDKDANDVFRLTVKVSDSVHAAEVPLNIYKLSIDVNVVQLTKESAHTEIDERALERRLSDVLGVDTRILVTQPYTDEEGKANASRSHVFVYGLDEKMKPMDRENLKNLLISHAPELSSSLGVSTIAIISTNAASLSSSGLALAAALVGVLLLVLLACCLVALFYNSQRNRRGSIEGDYMIDAVGAGPRPYDVENVTRTTAQNVLAARPLPDPNQHSVELAVSPAFLNNPGECLERSESTKEFSNSVRERPSLLQSALGRQKVHNVDVVLGAADEKAKK